MVANFLLEGDIAYTDQQIAESLGLSQRQVRAILEARLCKDFIAEAEVPSTGGHLQQQQQFSNSGSAWYRISPDVINASWYRFTQTEKLINEKLKSVQEQESYICVRCGGREFDSLRAVSLYSGEDGLFHCDICDDVLQIRENKLIRNQIETTLNEFCSKFEQIREKLESLTKMYIPRHIVIKKSVHEKLLQQSLKQEEEHPAKRTFSQFQNAVSNLGSYRGGTTAAAPSWIKQAQDASAKDEHTKYLGDEAFKGEENSTIHSMKIAKIVSLEKPAVSLPSVDFVIKHAQVGVLSVAKKEEVGNGLDDLTVTVGGTPYSVADVRQNDSLIERMTDEEYSRYDEIMQRIGFR